MRGTRGWWVAILAAGLAMALPASAQKNFTFESYAPGDVVGQDGWTLVTPDGTGVVVAGDNGPGGAGTKCLELTDQATGAYRIENLFADQVGTLPKLVTYKMDIKVVTPNSGGYFLWPYIPGGQTGYWHTNWSQWSGAYNPDGTHEQWSYGTCCWSLEAWHTHTWTMLYTDADGGRGQLLSYQIDGGAPDIRTASEQCFIRAGESSVLDRITIELNNAWEDVPGVNDVIRMDNISITAVTPPSTPPVANAGADINGNPCQTHTLNATGSTDDGTITRYRWMVGSFWESVLYDGPSPSVNMFLPGGTYTVLLQVWDNTGLTDTDMVEVALNYPYDDTIEIDFETYAPGNIVGQDCWAMTETGGRANVVNTDNGPSGPGGQCVELSNNQVGEWNVTIQKGFAPLAVPGQPRIVTFQYDYKGQTDGWACEFYPQVEGMGIGHWHTDWAQWMGARYPWGGWWGYDGAPFGNWGAWHTFQWTVLYSTNEGGKGRLLNFVMDGGTPFEWGPEHWCYLRDNVAGLADFVKLRLTDGWDGANDTVWIDNIRVSVTIPPSSPPVANAGNDVTQDPGSWDGVTLDGSASTDDVGIVRYRWTDGWAGAVLYDGPDAMTVVQLGEGTHEVVLEVWDGDGLPATDTVWYTIGALPPIMDNPVGPWAIMNGDIYGTNASADIPATIGPDTMLEIIDIGPLPGDRIPEDNTCIVFDQFGNLYYMSRCNNNLVSYSPNCQPRWVGHYPGGGYVSMGRWCAGPRNCAVVVGQRYVYAVGGKFDNGDGSPAMPARVYAYQRANGELAWETELPGEIYAEPYNNPPGETSGIGGPKITLYEDKVYVQGLGGLPEIDHVYLYQLDASTGVLDWQSNVWSDMHWYIPLPNPPGSFVFLPGAGTSGRHLLLWNSLSDPGAPWDEFADMGCFEIDPATGATTKWGPGSLFEGPLLKHSHPIYSAVTDRVYTTSGQGNFMDANWPYAIYAWDPTTGFVSGYTAPGTVEQQERVAIALDFDGRTIHTPGEGGTVRSYRDNGDGTWTYTLRDFGGPAVVGDGLARQGALVKGTNDHSVLVVASREGYGYPARVFALDLTAPHNPSGDVPIASVDIQYFENGEWQYIWYNCGPTPGPDGTFYVIHHRNGDEARIIRIGAVPAVPGACCTPAGDCEVVTPYNCAADGGIFNGAGVSCEEVQCSGACFSQTCTCVEFGERGCQTIGGIYAGGGSDCATTTCTTQYGEDCATALPLSVPGVAIGDSGGAAPSSITVCDLCGFTGPDALFQVVGTGYTMTAAACSSPSIWDAQLAVLTGPCEALECIGVGDDNCCPGSYACHGTVTWDSVLGQVYYVRMFGCSVAGGPYAVTVTSEGPTAPPVCRGDCNCDGNIGFADIDFFVAGIPNNEAAWAAKFPPPGPTCTFANCDVDGDGNVGFADIDPFVSKIPSVCP